MASTPQLSDPYFAAAATVLFGNSCLFMCTVYCFSLKLKSMRQQMWEPRLPGHIPDMGDVEPIVSVRQGRL